jgi:hemoglobin-like flavoprotein
VTPEQIALVERSVRAASPRLEAVAEDFYDRLFTADPTLRTLFAADPVRQRAKFAAELRDIMLAIRGHGAFLARVRALGARHAGYGVRAAHYDTVEVALLAALGAALGPAWTEEVAQAWRLAYRLVAEVMMAGAFEASLPVGQGGVVGQHQRVDSAG